MGTHRFAEFELDEDTRQLRLRGREIPLQPRVFDLLAYLHRERARVVDKETLLSALWPGVIVTDASLQRAVSLARRALRQGGLEKALRNYARRGYRFVVPDAPAASGPARRPAPLAAAQALTEQGRWEEAVAAFARADKAAPLAAADLAQWAYAAQCSGALLTAIPPLERAAEAYAQSGEPEAAARAAITLASIQLEAMATDVAGSWLRRAATLLKPLHPGEQHGHLAWVSSRYGCYVGDLPKAITQARRAIALGRRLGRVDLGTMGMLYLGVALQGTGRTREGMELQGEAAAAVLAGDVSPLLGGIVYCGLIAGCANAGDWPRARQWTESFTRWCRRRKMRTFAGACILHRAEVFAVRGDLDAAEHELHTGNAVLRESAPWAIGDAYRLLGDLRFMRGEPGKAAEAYAKAHEHGWDPNPGYAWLLHSQGHGEAALRSLTRAAESTTWVNGERRTTYLAALAQIAARMGHVPLAERTLALLDRPPPRARAAGAAAQVLMARGELSLARGKPTQAADLFRNAMRIWRDVECPIDVALAALRLAESYLQLGDRQAADLERSTAAEVFRKCGAIGHLKPCHASRGTSAGTRGSAHR